MTGLSKTAFFLICSIVVFTTLAYGAVHQPIIVAFYLLTAVVMVVWVLSSPVPESPTPMFSRVWTPAPVTPVFSTC